MNHSSAQSGERVAGVDGHRREALVGEPPDPRISGGSLALDPGHPKSDQPNLELLNHAAEPQPSRREMFRSAVRCLALGGISLMSAGLIARGAASPVQGGCRRSPSCGDCTAVTHCKLPQASAVRRGHKLRAEG